MHILLLITDVANLLQECILDELANLLKSTDQSEAKIEGILDISRCQSYQDSESKNDALSRGDSCKCCSDDTMVTYLVYSRNISNQANDQVTDNEGPHTKWFSQSMLLDDYERLLGPEPMIFLKYIESEQFAILPTTLLGDWFSENVQAVKYENEHLSQSAMKKSFYANSALYQFLMLYNEKIDNRMSLMVQESLLKTAGIDDNEVSVLRYYFYASSFPSRFLNCYNFCKNLCEIILGEMDNDRKEDYFRYRNWYFN